MKPILEELQEVYAKIGWTYKAPDSAGVYWHWNGDEDCGPLPMFVGYSGTSGGCFVQMGQLGISHAIPCNEWGGWWMPIYDPEIPKEQQAQKEQDRRIAEAIDRGIRRKSARSPSKRKGESK